MSAVLKLSGPIKVGSLSAAPSNPETGYIYYDSTLSKYQQYDGSGFVEPADFPTLASTASSKGASLVGIEDTAAQFTGTTVEAALAEALDAAQAAQSDATQAIGDASTADGKAVTAQSDIDAHKNGGTGKHDATEVDYERGDGSKKNIQATSDAVEAALTDLDDAVGALDATPTNYSATDAGIVADHLAGIDSALASAGSDEFVDSAFRVKGSADATKKMAFEVDGVTTSTTRTVTMPDADVDLGAIATNTAKVSADGLVTTHSDVTDAGSGAIITGVERSKLSGVESGATADQTGAEIKSAYEAEANTNAFTDTEKTTLGNQSGTNTGDEAAASATVSGTVELATIAEVDTGSDSVRAITPAGLAGSALQTKADASETFDTDLGLTTNGKGASKVSIEDASSQFTSTNVEGALDEALDAAQAAQSDVTTLDGQAIKKDGSVAFTGAQAMGSNKITGLADGTASDDAATFGQVSASTAGMLPKAPVQLAETVSNLTLSGEQTIDGTLTSADRILVAAQTDAEDNGIYITAAGAWSRAADADGSPSSEIQGGNSVFVTGGTVHDSTMFRLDGLGEITVDVGHQNWIIYSRAETTTASTGLTKVGLDIRMGTTEKGKLDNITVTQAVDLDTMESNIATNNAKVSADGSVATHSDVTDAGSGAIITTVERSKLSGIEASATADQTDAEIKTAYENNADTNAFTDANSTTLGTALQDVSDDTTPSLGGDLTLGANALIHDADGMKRGSSASNFLEEEYIHSIALSASQTDTVISALTFAHASFEGLEMVYKVKESTSGDVEIGTMRVVTNGSSVVISVVGTETAPTGISFSAAINGANVEIKYSSGSNGATLRGDVKRIKA